VANGGIVVFFGLQERAGRQAALAVILQTWAPIVDAEVVEFARAQRERSSNEVDDVAQASSVAERTKILAAVADELSREDYAREQFVERDLQIRIFLVVLEPHVERRLVLLDKIAFEQ